MASQEGAAASGSLLPYGIHVQGEGGCGAIGSALHEQFGSDPAGQAAADALESLLLAMHCAGIEVNTSQMAEAVTTAVDAIGNQLPELDCDEDPSATNDACAPGERISRLEALAESAVVALKDLDSGYPWNELGVDVPRLVGEATDLGLTVGDEEPEIDALVPGASG